VARAGARDGAVMHARQQLGTLIFLVALFLVLIVQGG
jgi:hypothetical protein